MPPLRCSRKSSMFFTTSCNSCSESATPRLQQRIAQPRRPAASAAELFRSSLPSGSRRTWPASVSTMIWRSAFSSFSSWISVPISHFWLPVIC